MHDLIPPHGGLTEPVNRTVPASEASDFRKSLQGLRRLPINDADLSSLYRLGDGGLSPLIGPMEQETFRRVLDDEVIVHNGKSYTWTIPVAFPVEQSLAATLKKSETVALVNSRDEVVGSLILSNIFPFDKGRYLKSVYGTDRTDHPGGHMVMNDPRTILVGGEVRILPHAKHPQYREYLLLPPET